MPLNKSDETRKIYYPLAFDESKVRVAYINNDTYENLIVEDLKTRKKQAIELEQKCESAFIGYCIDSISIIGNKLYYSFDPSASMNNHKKKYEYSIELDLK